MTRILICGGPRTGKTTRAESLQDSLRIPGLRHTDSLIHLGWSEASQAASLWLDDPGPWIIEGVAASRALRKWRERHPDALPPMDRLIRLTDPHVWLTQGQLAMARGEETVWQEIEPWLLEHGVAVA